MWWVVELIFQPAITAKGVPIHISISEGILCIAVFLEILAWWASGAAFGTLVFFPGSILNGDKFIARSEAILYVALWCFTIVARGLGVFCVLQFTYKLLLIEVIGLIALAAFMGTLQNWDVRTIGWRIGLLASLVVPCCLSILRVLVRLLNYHRGFSRWMHHLNPPKNYDSISGLLEQWEELQMALSQGDNGVQDSTHQFGYLPHDGTPCGNCLLECEQMSNTTQPIETFGFRHFTPCYCYRSTRELRPGSSGYIDDAELPRSRLSKRLQSWLEMRNGTLDRAITRLNHGTHLSQDEEQIAVQHRLCQTCQDFCYTLTLPFEFEELVCNTFYGRLWGFVSRKLGYARRVPYQIHEHMPSIRELLGSVQNGCHLCAIFWSSLNSDEQSELLAADLFLEAEMQRELSQLADSQRQAAARESFRIRRRVCIKATPSCIVPHFCGNKVPKRWLDTSQRNDLPAALLSKGQLQVVRAPWYIETFDKEVELNTGYFEKHGLTPISYNTGDDLVRTLIIHVFDMNPLALDSTWIPTRLVDVSALATTGRITVRSSEHTSDLAVKPAYVALSHCWGTETFLTYNKKTRERFESGIPVSALSKTFQEAMNLTDRLGFKFIWIDSLCILQKDSKD